MRRPSCHGRARMWSSATDGGGRSFREIARALGERTREAVKGSAEGLSQETLRFLVTVMRDQSFQLSQRLEDWCWHDMQMGLEGRRSVCIRFHLVLCVVIVPFLPSFFLLLQTHRVRLPHQPSHWSLMLVFLEHLADRGQ